MFTVCVVYSLQVENTLNSNITYMGRLTHYEGKFETIEEAREAAEIIGHNGVWVNKEETQLILPHHMVELSIMETV